MTTLQKILVSSGTIVAIGTTAFLMPQQDAIELINPGTTQIIDVQDVCSESQKLYTVQILNSGVKGYTSNNCTLEYMKALDEKDGVLVYQITKTQYDNIVNGYDVSLAGGKLTTSKGANALKKEQEVILKDNENIYNQIGAVVQAKLGKEAIGLPVTEEVAKIEALKLQLK